TSWNRGAERTYGWKAEEALGQSAPQLLRTEALSASPDRSISENGKEGQLLVIQCHKDGRRLDIETRVTVLRNERGDVTGHLAVNRDVTERRRAEEALRESQEETLRRHRELTALHNVLISITQTLDLETVLHEIVAQAGAALDSEYTSIVMVNQDGSLGTGSECFAGIPPLSVRARRSGVTRQITRSGQPIVVDDVDNGPGTNPALVAAGIKSYAGVPIRAKNATIGVLFVHSRQRSVFSGKADLLVAFANQAAIAMENARLYGEARTVGALREADRLKTELLSNVSHELRTPLASIKGFCTSILRYYNKMSDDDKRDSLREISDASDRLTELIENLLALSKLESVGLQAEKESVMITALITSAVEEMGMKAKGHRFVTDVVKPLSAVEADPRRIRQVLDNLLSNAVKYSPEGTTIRVSCRENEEELLVSVEDQGIGISREDTDRLFERFYRVASSPLHNTVGGAGLGLAICKRIVEAHGGRIWVESTPGAGSTFQFALPLAPGGPGTIGR
ncbi:MAG: ATP-binding protein, partial [Chloroflexi bacterium]|nr:ATP-binding protein [Chloroflexota bacterium]